MKRFLIALLVLCMLLVMASCGATKVLHCDHCNKEVKVREKSNMTEEWLIYCEECNAKLFSGDPILNP